MRMTSGRTGGVHHHLPEIVGLEKVLEDSQLIRPGYTNSRIKDFDPQEIAFPVPNERDGAARL